MGTRLRDEVSEMLRGFMLWGIVSLVCFGVSLPPAVCAQETVATKSGKYFTVNTKKFSNGTLIDETIINGPPTPPPGFEVQRQAVSLPAPDSVASIKTLSVPAFDWVFGCSSVSGAMIAGYYDRNGYPNMYTGPTSGGVMPMDNSSWPTWSDGSKTYPNCPLIASKNGVDGRAIKGSIDDYWVQYESTADDPYITGSWTQHTWGDAIGDYMKTSQSAYGNSDGSTSFYNYTDQATPLTCADMVGYSIDTKDGTYGRKLFYEARGYTVTDCYNQVTDNVLAGGFSFAQFKAEIDAGRPVMLNLAGHTIVGVGYDDSSNTVYIHDTWDYDNHTMTWGGSYSGLALQSVSIVNLLSTGLAVVSTTPADGATAVAISTPVSATFSQDMNASTINTSTFTMDNWVTGTVSYDAATRTATFTPSTPLAYNNTYTATITTGVANSEGTHLAAAKTWSFTTGSPVILLNGDFELGADGSWVQSSSGGWDLIQTDGAYSHAGSGYVWMGGYEGGTDVLYQDVAIPADATAAAFQFWYLVGSEDTSGIAHDILTVTVKNPTNNAVLQTLVTKSNVDDSGAYAQSPQYDLSAYKGQTIRLAFTATTNSDGLNTNFFLDDVTLQAVEQRTLSVSITGSGNVNSDPTGIACSTGNTGTCGHSFGTGLTVALMPTGQGGSIFSGWSGCTSLSGNNCLVSMTTNKAVTATFSSTANVRILGGSGYGSLQEAYNNAATTGSTIQARAMELPAAAWSLNLGKTVLMEGGYDSGFVSNNGYTTMTGVLTLGTGALTLENLIIK